MRTKKAILLVTVFFALANLGLMAQVEAVVRDILKNPEDWVNKTVVLRGEVLNVQAATVVGVRGYYVLMDSSDQFIKVVAEKLPAPGEKLIVTGVATYDTVEQAPFIRQTSASPLLSSTAALPSKKGPSLLIILLIAVIVVIITAILYVLLKKPHQVTAPSTSPARVGIQGKDSIGTAGTSTDAKTRQVSVAEVERQVGGMRTKQVPSLLAELLIMSGGMAGKSFPLGSETIIGRIRGDIILNDSSVSKEHAKVIFLGNKYAVENLSQTNPIILNGEKVQAQRELKNGDELIVGLIRLQFKLI